MLASEPTYTETTSSALSILWITLGEDSDRGATKRIDLDNVVPYVLRAIVFDHQEEQQKRDRVYNGMSMQHNPMRRGCPVDKGFEILVDGASNLQQTRVHRKARKLAIQWYRSSGTDSIEKQFPVHGLVGCIKPSNRYRR
jgi:hypothetical protein